jgi:hypothetical protein
VSDQDFFFDEDEKPAKSAGTPAPKKTGSPASTGGSGSPAKSPDADAPAQMVSMTIAILIGVIGILLGAVIGLFVGKSMAVPSAAVTPSAGAGTGTTQQAPQLTPEQLQGGQLPSGHPAVGGAATGTPAP